MTSKTYQFLIIGCGLILLFMLFTFEQSPVQITINPPRLVDSAKPSRDLDAKQEFAIFKIQLERLAFDRPCEPTTFGKDWGRHQLCEVSYQKPCFFYSFGIEGDWSFDRDLAAKSECFGYALDPSISHPTNLAPGVTFMQVAHSMVETQKWHTITSVPALKRWLKHDRIAVLKMDCEGCEYAVAEAVAREEPGFWDLVEQFAFEIHVPKGFMKTRKHLDNLVLLLSQLRKAGLKLAHADFTTCNPVDEAPGCLPELSQLGFPCDPGKMCINLLYARKPLT